MTNGPLSPIEIFEKKAMRSVGNGLCNRKLIVGGMAVLIVILVAASIESLLKPWDWGEDESAEEW